jgi:hypothetical protein
VVRRISIGIALACSVVLTYRIVSSATHLEVSQSMPLSTYQGFFAQVCITIWGLWGHARGLDPRIGPLRANIAETLLVP